MGKAYLNRVSKMLAGLVLSAVGVVMMLQANVGLDPWNALHQGISIQTGISFATATILVGAAVVLVAVLLKERIGFGTLVNVFGVGMLIDIILKFNWFPMQQSFWPGLWMLLAGLEALALGTYFFMSCSLGNGPRDSLMVAVTRVTHLPVGACRSTIEVIMLACGWLMGAKVGLGTVICAVGIGLFLQVNFALFRFRPQDIVQETFSVTIGNVKQMLNKTRKTKV